MNNLTMEDKRRIAARMFFQDNQDQYEDYHEALAEFISGSGQSDQFIEFCVQPVLVQEEGQKLCMNQDGHVAKIRIEDGFFQPLTEMSEDAGEKFQEAYELAAEQFPNIDELQVITKFGWKFIEDEPTESGRG